MIIAGFDLGMYKAAVAILDTSRPTAAPIMGTFFNQAKTARHPIGERLFNLRGWLTSVMLEIETLLPTEPGLERIGPPVEIWKESIVKHHAVIQTGATHGIFDEIVWSHFGVPVGEISPLSLKVLATNNGKAEKPDMVAAAAQYLKYVPVTGQFYKDDDFDRADALWVADFAARVRGYERPTLPPEHLRALHLEEPN